MKCVHSARCVLGVRCGGVGAQSSWERSRGVEPPCWSADPARVSIEQRRRAAANGDWWEQCGLRAGKARTSSELQLRHSPGPFHEHGSKPTRLAVSLKALACSVQ